MQQSSGEDPRYVPVTAPLNDASGLPLAAVGCGDEEQGRGVIAVLVGTHEGF